MRTSIDLPEALFRKAKMEAIHRKITFKALITSALEKEIECDLQRQRTMTAPPVGPIKGRVVRALSNAESAKLFEPEDLEKAIR